MPATRPSVAIQDYLKEIFKLQETGRRATTSTVADALGVTPPSTTAMLKRLASLGLAEHVPYRGVVLTEAGERVALEVIRHHRLLEQYLAETLGLPIDALHVEADLLEHSLSEELEARMDALLGYPTHDPHGDPIPDRELRIDQQQQRSLASLAVGDQATIRRVPDGDPELLRYLASLSLLPGLNVEVRELAPFDGPITIATEEGTHAVSRELAATIGVACDESAPRAMLEAATSER